MQCSKNSPAFSHPVLKLGAAAVLLAIGLQAQAGEGYKLRQSPVGVFGGEIASGADNPGFFGTASLSTVDIFKVVDGEGNNIVVPGRSQPLATATPTRGAIPNGTYTLNYLPGKIDFSQKQTNLNLVGGYLTQSEWHGGRFAFAVNLPLIRQSRTFTTTVAAGTISPSTTALPAALQGAVSAVAAATATQILAGVAATAAPQNADVSGIGDTELSAIWIKHDGQTKVAAGVSIYLPTGEYNKDRGPNPGFGKFVTLRPGVAVSHALNPNKGDSSWDNGVTVGARLSIGFNSTNTATDYRSGDFIYGEVGAVKVSGNFAFGANLLTIQQITNDSGATAPADGARYKNWSGGPFVSYKLPGQDAGFNLHYSESFASRNALVARVVQLRFIKAW